MSMRLHVIENDDRFPPLVDDLDNGDIICLDSPFLHNLGLGDQIQVFPDFETSVYIVVDIQPIINVPDVPGAKLVTLRNVY